MIKEEFNGAVIERGVISAVSDGKYKVRSVTRYGIVSPFMTALSGTYQVGDVVYYFLFNDGKGMILAAV